MGKMTATILFALTLLAVGSLPSARADELYGISAESNEIFVLNPADLMVKSSFSYSAPDATVFRGLGLAAHPVTGELWAVVETLETASGTRTLVKINPTTQEAVVVGTLPLRF